MKLNGVLALNKTEISWEVAAMSFVEDLNKQVSFDELLEAEEKYIKNYVVAVLNAVKYSCMKNKTQHTLSGYYGRWDYADEDEILEDEKYCSCRQLEGIVSLDTKKKELDLSKFKKALSDGIEELGFKQYQIEVKPYRRKMERKLLGIRYYDYENTNNYVVWISLEW